MATGKNGQFYYAPDVTAYINTVNDGLIDVSEDIVSFTVNRVLNATSSAQLYLNNYSFKYTPASNSNFKTNIPPVINTMDEIIISLKRDKDYYQVFTGFVTYAPIITLIPSVIEIQASCTLYKAQQSYWDSGAYDLTSIIPSILFTNPDNATNLADGGIGQGIINLLTKTCNWNLNDIHIEELPSKWISLATTVHDNLASIGQSSGAGYNSDLQSSKGISLAPPQTYVQGAPPETTLVSTKNSTGEQVSATVRYISEATVSQTIKNLQSNNKSANTIVYRSLGDVYGGGSTGSGAALNSISELFVDTSTLDANAYWCVVTLPTFKDLYDKNGNASKTKIQAIEEFIVGQGPVQPYPPTTIIEGKKTKTVPYSQGRLIQLYSQENDAYVWVNCIGILPNSLPGGDSNFSSSFAGLSPSVVVSPAAWEGLGFDLNSVTNTTVQNVLVEGWVNPNGQSLKLVGRSIQNAALQVNTTAAPTLPQTQQQTVTKNKSSKYATIPQAVIGALDPYHIAALGVLPMDSKGVVKIAEVTPVQWAYCLLRAIGIPDTIITPSPTNPTWNNPSTYSGNIAAVLQWIQAEGSWLQLCDPLNCSLQIVPISSTNRYKFRYPDVISGIYWTAQNLLAGNDGYPQIVAALNQSDAIQGHGTILTNFWDALKASRWDQNKYSSPGYGSNLPLATIHSVNAWNNYLANPQAPPQSVQYNMTAVSPGNTDGTASNSTITGPSSAAGGNFNTNLVAPNISDTATVLEGSTQAFVTDTQVLNTISTLAQTGLRVFQSGPDGSFLCWFPDYFGRYDTAPALRIYDIEILDLKIYHDDTQLYTHIGVSGDTTGSGTGVNIVDWMQSSGIITVQQYAILNMLFGYTWNDKTSLPSKFGYNNFDELIAEFLARYGMRPFVDEQVMIKSTQMEFMYAFMEFQMLWSRQYSTQASFTFMPELYPGMIVQFPEHNLQMFVQSVTHQGSRDGGFTTEAQLTCPTYLEVTPIYKKQGRGKNAKTKIVGYDTTPIPMDYGFPFKKKR